MKQQTRNPNNHRPARKQGEGLIDAFVILSIALIAILIFIFLPATTVTKQNPSSAAEFPDNTIGYDLQAFLQTPVTTPPRPYVKYIADLITYEATLGTGFPQTKEHFKRFVLEQTKPAQFTLTITKATTGELLLQDSAFTHAGSKIYTGTSTAQSKALAAKKYLTTQATTPVLGYNQTTYRVTLKRISFTANQNI
ncbi:hypothetical protein D6783_05050 [Candidatus Woesearchaeota archaeon]|nr:MAG: hypothetical protein D6783_05050 [Candidatus Woesearchaeota archaeon]